MADLRDDLPGTRLRHAFGYALIAARARNVVRNPEAIRIFNRTGGTLLVGAGIAHHGDALHQLRSVERRMRPIGLTI